MKKGLSDPARRFANAPTSRRRGSAPEPRSKRAVNLSVDEEVLSIAKELKINLSQAFEDTLRKLTEEERIRRYREENREATESYNAYIERNGVLGEELLDLNEPPV